MATPEAGALLAVIVVGWAVQIVLAHRQAMAVARRIADMRRLGTVAVGMGRGRFRSRTYAIVAVDRGDRVVGADVFRGWSTLASPSTVADVIGLPLDALPDHPAVASKDRALQAALHQAIAVLRDARAARDAERASREGRRQADRDTLGRAVGRGT